MPEILAVALTASDTCSDFIIDVLKERYFVNCLK